MLTFILGFLLGGMFGVFTIAMTVSAKQADEAIRTKKQSNPTTCGFATQIGAALRCSFCQQQKISVISKATSFLLLAHTERKT